MLSCSQEVLDLAKTIDFETICGSRNTTEAKCIKQSILTMKVVQALTGPLSFSQMHRKQLSAPAPMDSVSTTLY